MNESPVSSEIQNKILSMIAKRKYNPSTPLPSVRRLAHMLNVSTGTIQKVVKGLCEQGIIEGKPGKGLFVSTAAASEKNRNIALLLPYPKKSCSDKTSYPGNVVFWLKKELTKHNYTLDICSLHDIEDLTVIEKVKEMAPAGVVLLEVEDNHLILDIQRLCLPLVSIDYDAYHLGVSSVSFDNIWGGFMLTKNLIDMGHKEIAALYPQYVSMIGGNPYVDSVEKERIQGYRLAMIDADLPVHVVEYPPGEEALHTILLELFSRPTSPTALVCKGDYYARLVIKDLQNMGYSIPEDVIVTGFTCSDSKTDGKTIPGIVFQPKDMGIEAGHQIIALMKDRSITPGHYIIPPELVMCEIASEKQLS
jgi:DNA-binding LacI/PurR family transcriptional regulator